MQIGIAYDLKTTDGLLPSSDDLPDDLHEEFDSPATIEAIRAALRGLGHEVVLLGDGHPFLERVLSDPPQLVFNVAEGQGVGRSREARVPAVLEMLGIPCTGSDPLTLAATLDKDCAKRLVASVGVAVPRGVVLSPGDPIRADGSSRFPLILKPACEGSSKGIRNRCLVRQASDLAPVLSGLWRDYHQPVLVEEFIDGDELTVGLVGNDPPEIIGVMRVLPTRAVGPFVYSLEVKRDFRRQVRYECPARLSAKDQAAVERAALAVWRVLGCRDVSRVDFRLRDGVPYFLEVNPLPGLNPESSDLVILAGLRGWSYEQLIERILGSALRRLRIADC
ncbi:MAG: ATP-grasp domain-containing protein [Gemmataceae bacterium]|nr:ATP-grasp domain-containing protein [Gemmataceae bacterium]